MKKILFFFAFLLSGILSAQTPFYKDIVIQKITPYLHLNGLNGFINFYNGDLVLTHSSDKLTLSGGYFDFGATRPIYGGAGMLNFTDSTLYYFTYVRGVAMELDLATYSTLPSPVGQSGKLYGADGTNIVLVDPPTGGSGSATDKLQFIIGTTSGAPANGTSTIYHTGFVEKHVEVVKNGLWQYRNVDYSFNKQTGIITTNPVVATNDKFMIYVTDSTTWTDLVLPEGGGGGTSSLLTGIKTYYKLDETAIGTLDDATGNKDITTDATVNQTGIIGKAIHLGWEKEVGGGGYDAATSLNWSTWTVKMWFKLDSLPGGAGGTGRPYTLFSTIHNPGDPYWNALLRIGTDNRLWIRVKNTAEAAMESFGDTISTVGRWYHVVVRFRGNGYTTQIFKDGQESTEAGAEVFSGTLYQVDGGEWWGTSAGDDPYTWMSGSIDECGTWARTWSDGEILQNYNDEKGGKTYPWTP